MFRCSFKIKSTIDTKDDEIADLMTKLREEKNLAELSKQLGDFESASKELQSEDGVTLLDVRDIFDEHIVLHPPVAYYLGPSACIVKRPGFENACVTALLNRSQDLEPAQI